MPVLVVDDYRLTARSYLTAVFENGICLLGYTLVELLAVFVVLVDVFALSIGIGSIFSDEQLYGLHTRLHSAGSIDTWTNLENHITDGNFLVCHTANLDNAPQSHIWVGVQSLDAVICHYAVLPGDRNYVGCYAHSHKVKQTVKLVGVSKSIALCKSLHEFESHSAP